ncbi:MAG: alcohol dehydrogenase catalytic domain-containing protein [Pseudomonadota bacterium]
MAYRKSLLSEARRIEIVEAEMPAEIPAGHARLRLGTASICGTDMHYFRHFANAGFQLDYPITLGHEACAYMVDGNGASINEGALVAINPIIECGRCDRCATGDINMCATKQFPGSATTKPHIDGFFREYFDFPVHNLHVVDPTTNPDHLTFTEPLACAMHCVRRAGITADSSVLVTGCGPMGLLAVVGAAALGAEVHVTDLKQGAIDVAQSVGATNGFLIGNEGYMVPANSYDVVIEASGSPHAYNQALEAVRKQGVVAVLSLIQPSPVPINLHLVALKEITTIGSILYTDDFVAALDLIQSGNVDFDRLIGGRFSVSQTQSACEFMAGGEAIGKVLIKP